MASSEITVADLTGRQTLMARCRGCGHDAPVSKAKLPQERALMRLRLRCSKCNRTDGTELLVGPQPYRTVLQVALQRIACAIPPAPQRH